MKSVMKHSFAQVPQMNTSRTAFKRSHGHKTTINADILYPIYVDEMLPGDTLSLRANMFARLATPIHPIMDNMFLETFFFGIPNRILWSNWNKFLGEQDNPGDSIDYTIPRLTIPSGGFTEETIFDYMGLPPGVEFTNDVPISALFFRALNKCWNDWFRDQNLQSSLTENMGDGPDDPAHYALFKRGKRHDYFTSCLPFAQKSDTPITLPLGQTAPIVYGSLIGGGTDREGDFALSDTDGSNGGEWHYSTDGITDAGSVGINTTHFLNADLSQATAATINAIRLAVTTQQFVERDARGGTRINEIIWSHFGVHTLDYRVQRPEYLGGGSQPIQINSVPQTSETAAGSPQGNLAAFGTVFAQGHGFTKSFTEHTIVIGFVNARADLTYQQGVNKMFTRQTRFDFFWPEFQHLGEQTVLQYEIEATGAATDIDVFGYQERYAEYRFKPSLISGKFRSSNSGTLDPWHLSEELSAPGLNAAFIEPDTPMARVKAITTEPDFILDCYFDINHVRPISLFGDPGLMRF